MTSKIVLKQSDFESEEAKYKQLFTLVQSLLKTNHVMTIFNDVTSKQLVLKFAYVDPSKKIEENKEAFPHWLYPEQAQVVAEYNKVVQEETLTALFNQQSLDNTIDDSVVDDDVSGFLPERKDKNKA